MGLRPDEALPSQRQVKRDCGSTSMHPFALATQSSASTLPPRRFAPATCGGGCSLHRRLPPSSGNLQLPTPSLARATCGGGCASSLLRRAAARTRLVEANQRRIISFHRLLDCCKMSTSQTSLSAMYRDAGVKAVAKAAPRQTTYEDIPKFPYGYHDEKDPPKTGFLSSGSKLRPPWAPKNYKDLKLEHNFLPTNPNKHQLKNLFNQVRHHFNTYSPLTFEGDSAVNGAYTTRYPLPPSSPPAKDTYYIIRMRTRRRKGTGRQRFFIEFLFRDGDNYLIAWRVFTKAEQCKTAHWFFFTDTKSHMNDELFKNMAKICVYGSGYANELKNVKIHGEVLEDIAIFLKDLYEKPLQKTHDQGSLYFHTLFVLLGEGPRFAPLDDSSAVSITKHKRYVDPLGTGCLYDLIKSWKKISFTILLLKLLLVEEAMIAGIKQTRPHFSDDRMVSPQFRDLFDEAVVHREKIMVRLASLYEDAKELDEFAALNKEVIEADVDVGDATLQRMVNRFLHLVKFDKDLVPAVLVREDDFQGALGLDLRSL